MTSDDKLIRNIKHHSDRKAADELFERYYREIYAYVFRQCGERELAMDLTQDIFMAVFQGIYGFDRKKAIFRTWLYHVASNKITDFYRSRRHREHLKELPLDDIDVDVSDDSDILVQLAEKETVQEIMKIVSVYELAWIHIFQMKCFEERTFSDIAATLNIPENTVKSRYYAIVKRLRKEFFHEN